MKKKILIIAAHPDDEVLGCGGTIARLAEEGNEVYSLIMGEGVTARDEKCNLRKRRREILVRKQQMKTAGKILGIKKSFSYNLPDNRFDSIPLIDIVKKIEKIKNLICPQIIFTHFKNDLNIDHQITYQAVITATRPMVNETTKEIYSFEVLSSTEWNYPLSFSPNMFVDVTRTIDLKITAMGCYKLELRDFPHPRSLEFIKINSMYWGARVGLNHAESFQVVRLIK
jgi:LmbE family N-acetylglucosaminyl deacetylase